MTEETKFLGSCFPR